MLSRESSATLLDAVTAFIYREARFQDEHQYEAWEALWTDDGVYWVPANGADIDPEKEMSIIYDNRSRIALRVRQLLTGKHFTQTPQSRLRRLVSNIELLDQQPGGDIAVGSNSMIFEFEPARRHGLGGPQRVSAAPCRWRIAHGLQEGHSGQQREGALHAFIPGVTETAMIDKGPVLLDIADGIARLRLNRPDAANGMSVELLSALCDAIMACHGHPDLRVVLLSGEGDEFLRRRRRPRLRLQGREAAGLYSPGDRLSAECGDRAAAAGGAGDRLRARLCRRRRRFWAGLRLRHRDRGGVGKVPGGCDARRHGAGCRRISHAVASGRPAPSDVDPVDQPGDPGGRGTRDGHRHKSRAGCRTWRAHRLPLRRNLRPARRRRLPRPSGWSGPAPAPASSNACRRRRAPCLNCLGRPMRAKALPP